MRVSAKQTLRCVLAVALLGAIVISALPSHNVYASQITSRSLTLENGASAGGSQPSGVVKHLFSYTLPTAGTIHSVLFQYCTKADGTCTTPHGMSSTSATLGTQSGASFDSVVNTTNGSPYVTSAAGVSITANEAVTTELQTVTNPDGTDCPAGNQGSCTFFVRITSYTSTNATTGAVDNGVVAASTAQAIVLSGTMPESLTFCTGGTVSTTNSVPDCSTATSGNVSFNADFSPTATAYTTTQMAASTNAKYGYVITVSGSTLTSGSNTITAIGGTKAASTIGSTQFGLNLVHNTTPAIASSANIAPSSDGVNYWGYPTTNFNTGGSYAFNSGGINTIAKSDNNTGTAEPSDSQIYTASYIVNVRGNQAPGTYTTTLTYICTPTF